MNKLYLLLMFLFSMTAWGQERERYYIGDIYDVNGVRGIVVMIKENGLHGLIMSLDEEEKFWSLDPTKRFKYSLRLATSAIDKNDGANNMEAIAQTIEQHNLSWNWFPAFQWCKNKGEGWYLPAINELVEINKAYHGGRIESNKSAKKAFNKILEENGGKPLKRGEYLSSSEFSGDKIYAIYLETGLFAYGHESQKGEMYVRAVRKF